MLFIQIFRIIFFAQLFVGSLAVAAEYAVKKVRGENTAYNEED